MFQGKEETEHLRSVGNEVSFTSIARFLKLNKMLILFVTVAFSGFMFASSFLVPQQYSKELTYSVKLTQAAPNAESVTPLQVGYSAVDLLEDARFSRVAVSSRYVESEKQTEVFIQSWNRGLLKKTDSRVTSLLETKLRGIYEDNRRSDGLNADTVSITLVSSSSVEQPRPNSTIGGIAIVSGFVIAVVLAILRTALNGIR